MRGVGGVLATFGPAYDGEARAHGLAVEAALEVAEAALFLLAALMRGDFLLYLVLEELELKDKPVDQGIVLAAGVSAAERGERRFGIGSECTKVKMMRWEGTMLAEGDAGNQGQGETRTSPERRGSAGPSGRGLTRRKHVGTLFSCYESLGDPCRFPVAPRFLRVTVQRVACTRRVGTLIRPYHRPDKAILRPLYIAPQRRVSWGRLRTFRDAGRLAP